MGEYHYLPSFLILFCTGFLQKQLIFFKGDHKMEDTQIRKFDMFNRVRDYGISNAVKFPPNSLASELFGSVNSIVKELSIHAVKKDSGNKDSRRGTATKATLREELREDMLAISRTARFMTFTEPRYEDKFRMPRNGGDQALLTSARAFAEDAAAFVSEFVRRELPENFIEELNNKIQRFEKAVSDRNLGAENRVIAVTAIDQTVERGMDTVRELDSLVKNKFRNDPTMLAAWDRARHIERAPRPAVAEETPAPVTADK
jgi:hypothetical protein